MIIKITSSRKAEDIITKLRYLTKLEMNVLGRIGMSFSIYSGAIFNENKEFEERTGKEFNIYSLLGEYEVFYRSILSVKENRKISDDEFEKFLRFHLENGLRKLQELLVASNEDSRLFLSNLGKLIPATGGYVNPKNINPLSIIVGEEELTKNPVIFDFNNTKIHANPHLAIMGTTGAGKTQVLLKILYDLRRASQFTTNFIFFDYKGEFLDKLGNSVDSLKNKFVEDTKSKIFQLPGVQLPINPFILPRYDDSDIKISAEEKAESFISIGNIGTVQKEILIKVIKNAYEARKNKSIHYPDFNEIYKMLSEEYKNTGKKEDTLTGVIRKLSEFNLFWSHDCGEEVFESLFDKTLIVDISKLPALKELVAYLVIERLYKEMTTLPDSKVVDGYRHIRTILVIDEAHNYLSQKNTFLQKIIREGRSKGVAVFFASQSPSDYDQKFFDFKELLEFIMIFESKSINTNTIQDLLGCSGVSAKELRIKIPSLAPFECVTSSPNPEKDCISFKAHTLFEALGK